MGECHYMYMQLHNDNDSDNDEQNEQSMIDMIKDETTRDATIPAAFLLGKDGWVSLHVYAGIMIMIMMSRMNRVW